MDAELPQLLDLLAAGSAAGLSAVVGLERAVAGLRGPLGRELRGSLDAVELGSRWREELGAVAERLALPDLKRTVAVLTRTETLRGVPDGRDARPGGRRAARVAPPSRSVRERPR